MSDSEKAPKIVDYGGRRTRFDRRMEIEVSQLPEKRSGHGRRSGYDRRGVANNKKNAVEIERRSSFEPFLKSKDQDLPEEDAPETPGTDKNNPQDLTDEDAPKKPAKGEDDPSHS